MNLAEAAQLILTLALKDEVSSGLKGIQGQLDKTQTKGASLSSGLGKVGTGIGVGITNAAKLGGIGLGLLWTQVNAGIDSLVELEGVEKQTEATIKSTGGAAKLTAQDIRDLAVKYEDLSGVDDKVVQSGENVLLTFQNISHDAFEPALQAALDMSQAMGQDLQSSIVQVGKALNDPATGLSSLSRIGVTFDDATKKIIQDMVDTGDTAGAQKIILQELNDEFGGSAQASMDGYRGTQLRLKDTWEDLQQTLATALLPALDNLSRTLKNKLADPAVKDGVKKLGEGIASLFSPENVAAGGDALKGLFNFLKDLPWSTIKDGMQFAADNAKKVVDVFRSLPPGVQAGLLTFLAANKLSGGLIASGLGELAKVALSSLKTITAGNVTLIAANVTGSGGGPGNNLPIPPGSVPVAEAGLSVATIASGVALGTVVAVAAVSSVAAISNEIYARQGFTNQEIDLQNQITQDEALRAHATTKAAADAIQARIDENKAKLATLVTTTQLGNQITSEAKDRLGQTNTKLAGLEQDTSHLGLIERYSQVTANKQTSFNINIRTSLTVAGSSVAEALEHYYRLNPAAWPGNGGV